MKISKLIFLFLYLLPLYSIAQKTATLIYIDQYKDIAVSEMKRTGIPASITLAQGIIESNSGESNLALNFKNHFGIKLSDSRKKTIPIFLNENDRRRNLNWRETFPWLTNILDNINVV